MAERPAIPAAVRREVLMETGYACAIPACRESTTELAHITPWAKVKEHTFDNLIALCPNHHTRYDRGEIPKKALLAFKANLAVLNGRYSDLERRLLEVFAEIDAQPGKDGVPMPGGMELLMMRLVNDGIVQCHDAKIGTWGMAGKKIPMMVAYSLTTKGRAFLDRWLGADPLL